MKAPGKQSGWTIGRESAKALQPDSVFSYRHDLDYEDLAITAWLDAQLKAEAIKGDRAVYQRLLDRVVAGDEYLNHIRGAFREDSDLYKRAVAKRGRLLDRMKGYGASIERKRLYCYLDCCQLWACLKHLGDAQRQVWLVGWLPGFDATGKAGTPLQTWEYLFPGELAPAGWPLNDRDYWIEAPVHWGVGWMAGKEWKEGR
jgi:hypothetical protein